MMTGMIDAAIACIIELSDDTRKRVAEIKTQPVFSNTGLT